MQHAETIREFVVREFLPDVSAGELDMDRDLLESGIVDSLGLLKVIAWLEERYDVVAEDEDLTPERFRSVASIAEFLEQANRHPSEAE
ncbi:acyl carrier protein [Nocardiopsis arvandica]|uniref:Acyl carrier protein n=1 Tax=Nocardiopsis sinuspersici TaxID=501010 RepID=A0A7Y9XJ48_9ACTN|nr:acyl carrier protein [Nocardiopsis sinuspersici]